jgi:hypothetical protein
LTGLQWRWKASSSSAYTSLMIWNSSPTQTVLWRSRNSASSISGGWRNLSWTLRPSQTFTEAQLRASCLSGWYGNCTTRNRRVVCPKHHQGHTVGFPGHLKHQMSQEIQKDHQGHQPPEPWPVLPAIIQKSRSIQVHQSWDRESEKQLLSQVHQTVKNSHH